MEDVEHPDPERMWRHRRWMGWYGVLGAGVSALVGLLVLVAIEPEATSAVVSITVASIWAHLGLAAIYAGGASLVDAMARLRHGRV